MPDEVVNASPADIRKLASALNAYRQEVTAASKKVRSAIGSANWHDGRKAQFEARYQDLQKRIDTFMSGEVDHMVKTLNDLARRLEDIRSLRL
jgi:chromosome segregation ATPase